MLVPTATRLLWVFFIVEWTLIMSEYTCYNLPLVNKIRLKIILDDSLFFSDRIVRKKMIVRSLNMFDQIIIHIQAYFAKNKCLSKILCSLEQ